jgi:hypothetical protein
VLLPYLRSGVGGVTPCNIYFAGGDPPGLPISALLFLQFSGCSLQPPLEVAWPWLFSPRHTGFACGIDRCVANHSNACRCRRALKWRVDDIPTNRRWLPDKPVSSLPKLSTVSGVDQLAVRLNPFHKPLPDSIPLTLLALHSCIRCGCFRLCTNICCSHANAS